MNKGCNKPDFFAKKSEFSTVNFHLESGYTEKTTQKSEFSLRDFCKKVFFEVKNPTGRKIESWENKRIIHVAMEILNYLAVFCRMNDIADGPIGAELCAAK